MLGNAEVLVLRPRRRPPAPQAVDSWAFSNINIRNEQLIRSHSTLNLVHLRNALIDARHYSGEGEPYCAEATSGAISPTIITSSARVWSVPQPLTDAQEAAPSMYASRQSLRGFSPPHTSTPEESDSRRRPPETKLSDLSWQQATPRLSPRLQQPQQALIPAAHAPPSHAPSPPLQPHPLLSRPIGPPSTRPQFLGPSKSSSTLLPDLDLDLLDGLDVLAPDFQQDTATEAAVGVGKREETRPQYNWSLSNRSNSDGQTRNAMEADVNYAQQQPRRHQNYDQNQHEVQQQRQERQHHQNQQQQQQPQGKWHPEGSSAALSVAISKVTEREQCHGAEREPIPPGTASHTEFTAASGLTTSPITSSAPAPLPSTDGCLSAHYGGEPAHVLAGSTGRSRGDGRGDGSVRWWEDLNAVLGSNREAQGEAVDASAVVSARALRRNSSGPRQAVLTADGGCRLPPPPPHEAVWKAMRPDALAAVVAAAGSDRASAAAGCASESIAGVAMEEVDATGTRTRKRLRSDGGGGGGAVAAGAIRSAAAVGVGSGCAADPSAASYMAAICATTTGSAARGGSGKRKPGAKDGLRVAGGGSATEALLAQLLPLYEDLEEPDAALLGAPIRDVSDARVVPELVRDISRSRLLLAGLLVAVCEGPVVQFTSNMQSVSKPQRDALLKARRMLAKDPAASAAVHTKEAAGFITTTPTSSGSWVPGVLASEHLERCVALCVMCLDQRLYEELLSGGGGGEVVGTRGSMKSALAASPMYVLPTAGCWPSPTTRRGMAGGGGGGRGSGPGGEATLSRPQLLSLLDEILVRAPCPTLCCNSKALLREALCLGWSSPPPPLLRLMDPCVLAWMEAPQLAQRDEREIEGYTLEALCPRYGIFLRPPSSHAASLGGDAACDGATGPTSLPTTDGPLARLRLGLLATGRLFEAVRERVQPWLRPQAVQVEMQVSGVLARMEARGIAVDTAGLGRKAAAVRRRMAALSAAAAALLGGQHINLGSSAQLAVVLYETLKLPPPVPQGQRDAASGPGRDRSGRNRIHHSTDETALKAISHLHPLPTLVLQYRALQNVLSKWLEPEWMEPLMVRSGAAAGSDADPGAGGWGPSPLPRLSCSWNQTSTATGRLSSSAPNLQAVTKYEVAVQLDEVVVQLDKKIVQASTVTTTSTGSAGGGECLAPPNPETDDEAKMEGASALVVVARNAFVALSGRLLVAADYSQIELRLLAHLSGDLRLQELLCRGTRETAGGGADAFRHIAAAWLRPGTLPADISSRDREQVKRVVYGIIYGMTAQGLAQQLAEYGVGLEEATALRASFLRHFAGVQAFITSSLHHARRHGYVTTAVLGRRRPISGVTSTDPRVRADAERKVVNSIVQGSAADLVKCAMCMWASFVHPEADQPPQSDGPRGPLLDAELIAQIHDELVFEVEGRREVVERLVAAVRGIMCGVVPLDVPLLVKVAAGSSWGAMKELPAGFGEEVALQAAVEA